MYVTGGQEVVGQDSHETKMDYKQGQILKDLENQAKIFLTWSWDQGKALKDSNKGVIWSD